MALQNREGRIAKSHHQTLETQTYNEEEFLAKTATDYAYHFQDSLPILLLKLREQSFVEHSQDIIFSDLGRLLKAKQLV
jgi:hypothetical protein